MFSPEDFVSEIPIEVKNTLITIINEGYVVTFVGGSVRDYILTGKLGTDLDIELTHKNKYQQAKWLSKLNDFHDLLTTLGFKVSKSDRFYVYKIDIDKYSLEFASARTEEYISNKSAKGHSDFDVTFHSHIDPIYSFKRRDFTCNAIAIKLEKNDKKLCGSIIDPFNGIEAISKKLLIPCHDSFKHDPVRYLRAIRFEQKLNFNFSDDLINILAKMNLLGLTSYYFLSESLKVNILLFSKRFFELIDLYNTQVTSQILSLHYFSKFKENPILKTKEEVMDFLIVQNVPLNDLEIFREIIGMKKSDFKKRAKSACR